MDHPDTALGHFHNADQIAFWNGSGGQRWVERQQAQDAIFAPISDILIDRAKVQSGERVLDIGCGCGATTFATAEKVGPSGHVLGLDVSTPMIARAKELALGDASVEFVQGDATVHRFKAASTDLMLSRFGVMFFAEPIRAFLNIRTALRSEARLAFACWRELRDNLWLSVPLEAAYDHVPKLSSVPPNSPDPFAFASRDRVEHILVEAGFRQIRFEQCDLSLDISTGNGLDGAVRSAVEMGPASRALAGQPTELLDAAVTTIRKSLSRYAKGQTVSLPASFWLVTAVDP
jgi:SAM-dependent methyltransferase